MWVIERVMTRGRDRTADRSRDSCTAEDHQTTGAKNDRAAAYPGVEDREGMEGEQGVLK